MRRGLRLNLLCEKPTEFRWLLLSHPLARAPRRVPRLVHFASRLSFSSVAPLLARLPLPQTVKPSHQAGSPTAIDHTPFGSMGAAR
jgi:hypothetical protein